MHMLAYLLLMVAFLGVVVYVCDSIAQRTRLTEGDGHE